MKILIVALVGLAVFLFFRAAIVVSQRIRLRQETMSRIAILAPATEFAVWLIFFFWALYYLLQEKTYFPYLSVSLVIALVVLFTWFLLRDIVAGIILRLQNALSLNQQIRFGTTAGKISKLGLTRATLQTPQGEFLTAPYSRLSGEIIAETSLDETPDRNNITISIRKTGSQEETAEKIRRALLTIPWTALNKQPIITMVSETPEAFTYEIIAYSLTHNHMRLIKETLKKKFPKD